jgi:hypothetical protein
MSIQLSSPLAARGKRGLFRRGSIALVLFSLALIVSACAAPGAPPTDAVEQAQVESVDLLMLESFPVQIVAIARGNLPDACAFIDTATQRREGNAFEVTLTIARQPNARCAAMLTPFEHRISLDVVGLKAGAYTVSVNGVKATFELSVDNVLPGTSPD